MALQEVLSELGFRLDQGQLKAIEGAGKRVEQVATRAAEGVEKISGSMSGVWTWVKRIAAGIAVSRGFSAITSDVSRSVEELDKWNVALGVSVDRLQELEYAGKTVGLQLEDVGDVMKELAVKANDAFGIAKSKDAQELFKQMGIGKEQIVGVNGELKSTDELLLVVADAFSKMTNRAKAGAAIDDLLSDAGVRAAKLFNLGRKGIEDLAKQARESGLLMDKRTIQAARLYAAQKRQIIALLTGFRNVLASKVLPPLTAFIKRTMEWIREGDRAERIMLAAKRAGAALAFVLVRLGGVYAVRKLQAFASALLAAAASMRSFGTSALFAQLKSALIVGAVTALVLAVIDLYETMQGKETITTRLVGDPDKIEAIKQAVGGFVQFFTDLWTTLGPVVLDLLKEIGRTALGIVAALGPVVRDLAMVVLDLFKVLAPVVGDLIGAIAAVAASLLKAIRPILPAIKVIVSVLMQLVMIPLRLMILRFSFLIKLLGAVIRVVVAIAKATEFIWGPVLKAIIGAISWISSLLGRVAELIELAFSDPVEAARQAWEGLTKFFSDFWKTFKSTAEDAILWLIKAFLKVPKAIKAAWNAVIGGIKRAIMAIVNTVMYAVNALRAITGKQQVGGALKKGQAAAVKSIQSGDASAVMLAGLARPLPGPVQPADVDRRLGRTIVPIAPQTMGAGPTNITEDNRFNAGGVNTYVSIAVTAKPGEDQLRGLPDVLEDRIKKTLKSASRDLRKPKRGQR